MTISRRTAAIAAVAVATMAVASALSTGSAGAQASVSWTGVSVMQVTPDVGSAEVDISFALGRGAYEGIQNDSEGNLWIVEDSGGTTVPTAARNPNSFVYRFIPYDKRDLTKGGVLQALRVMSNRTHAPITFQAVDAAHPGGGAFTRRPGRSQLVRQHVRHPLGDPARHPRGHQRPALQRQRGGQGGRRHPVQAAGERAVPAG